ncbi:MAG: hyaluronate lyase [Sulfurovum sp. PC08-66]|nr:MAG: hyaluronate lyase [Sulfurovum sp. PC08-66]KIM12603.1 MAG: hyaluronate lyase [Sulfuricurvum sp. PC08-66]
MRIVIAGGGIAGAYMANALLEAMPNAEVLIVSDEAMPPYDRIHLCALVNGSESQEGVTLALDGRVELALGEAVESIDTQERRIYTAHASYKYDRLIVATGSKPRSLFPHENLTNVATFRSASDSARIAAGVAGANVLIMGVGPIGLELLDTLMRLPTAHKIYVVSRGRHLYDKSLSPQGIAALQKIFEQDPRVEVLFEEEIVTPVIEGNRVTSVVMHRHTIENPFIVFGVGIAPNVAFARASLTVEKGIVVNDFMQSSDPFVYAVGEAAQVASSGFIAGRVKECTRQADAAISHIVGKEPTPFSTEVAIDGLKVGAFLFTDVSAPWYEESSENENLLIESAKEGRIDQYILRDNKLVRFIGINSNIDPMALSRIIEAKNDVDAGYFYTNRLMSERGRLVCSCESVYAQDLVDIIQSNAVTDFTGLKPYTKAGRTCGRCKKDVSDIIKATPVDPEMAARIQRERLEAIEAAKRAAIEKRIEKFNRLHPANRIDATNLDAALESMDMNKEYNRWVSMITSSMRLDPSMEPLVDKSVKQLNKIPIIWLELSDCTGNSEAFIKTAHPKVDDLILKYISLDYHELLMAASGDQSELTLDTIIEEDKGRYLLLVEGAVPLGMEGKFLRIGPKGETGEALLRRVARDAAAVFSIGSCALDGGVVAAAPNPTGAVGVAQALGRDDVINLPGCPVNPINVVGTLLHYIMFDELPALDAKNRPLWAYSQRIHDNCERRGHYDLDEFVLEWGDEGAKKGWCLFQMGCKGPYADLNCSLVKFNEGTSWPVQVGHGCFGCGEGVIAFDSYANQRKLPTA